jgi:hypothetical protein
MRCGADVSIDDLQTRESSAVRKIVHVDMDAFYASVEQRDDSALRGRPVVVAWHGPRSVVCAASYEARKFGIRSAMPALRAARLCSRAVFIPPDFTRYKAVSLAVREIFSRHSDLIEPLSLDEAYLDVTENKTGLLQEVIKGFQALRGIAHISAVTIAAELGEFSRFEGARQLMGYSGIVPSEDSSGERTQRGSITKTGNSHLRRIAVEAAWSYRLRPCVGPALRKRQEGVAEEIKEIAWKAQHRLYKRNCRLAATRKDQRKIITALGRELLGFIWAIGIKAEAAAMPPMAA